MKIDIKTERLLLREFKISDAEELYKICNEMYILKWMPDWEMSLEDLKELIKWFEKCYDDLSFNRTMLAITLEDSGDIIGMVGVGPKKEVDNEIEIAYYISEKYSNQGYMSEAVNEMTQWVFKTKGLEYIIAIVEPDNFPSQKVVNKCGFTLEGTRNLINSGDTKRKLFNYYRLYNGDYSKEG